MDKNAVRQKILQYISDERDCQDEKWGGKDHDLKHPKNIWTRLIVRQLGDADCDDN